MTIKAIKIELTPEQYKLVEKYRARVCRKDNPGILFGHVVFYNVTGAYLLAAVIPNDISVEIQKLVGKKPDQRYGDSNWEVQP